MSARTVETVSGVRDINGFRIYTGSGVSELGKKVIGDTAELIHGKLGVENRKGHMHQPSLDDLVAGMEEGNFVLSFKGDIVVSTSHIRPAKRTPGNKELGGVIKLHDLPGSGKLVAVEGTRLAVLEHGANAVEALVAQKNAAGLMFFGRFGREIGARKSDYVKDLKTGEFANMVNFDVTHQAGERI